MDILQKGILVINVFLQDKSFRPDLSTVRGRAPAYWQYVDNIGHSAITVKTHFEIFQNFQTHPKQNQFGMAWESPAIVPQLYDALMMHHKELKKYYQHIFTYHPSLLERDSDLFKYAPSYGHWINTNYGGYYDDKIEKTECCSLVVSDKQMTGGHAMRAWLAQRYTKQGLHVFGAGVSNPFAKSTDVLGRYRFHLAIENHVCKNYITEKILNCFATETIPIYWGCPNLGDWFNLNGVIGFEEFVEGCKTGRIDNYLTESLYRSKLSAIKENLQRVQAWGVPIEDYIHETYLKGYYA